MEFALIIWLISTLNPISSFLTLSACILAAAGIMFFVDSVTDGKAPSLLWAKRLFVSAFIATFVATLLPSTKTAWMMAGAYTAQIALESDTAKKLASIVELKLQEVLDEATANAKIKIKEATTTKE